MFCKTSINSTEYKGSSFCRIFQRFSQWFLALFWLTFVFGQNCHISCPVIPFGVFRGNGRALLLRLFSKADINERTVLRNTKEQAPDVHRNTILLIGIYVLRIILSFRVFSFSDCSKCQDHYSAMLHNRLALPSLAETMKEYRVADQNGFWPLRPGILPLTASADCPFWKTSSHKFGDTFQIVGISRRIECRCPAEWDSANIGTPSFWWRTYALSGLYSHFVRTLFLLLPLFLRIPQTCVVPPGSSVSFRLPPFPGCVSTHHIMQSFPFWAQR